MNAIEQRVRENYEKLGWLVLQKGWPDFFCVRLDEAGKPQFQVIEVKSSRDHLRPEQKAVMDLLSCFMPAHTIIDDGHNGFDVIQHGDGKPDERRAAVVIEETTRCLKS